MIILTYTGILLFCYGVYNLMCYFQMLPTARSGRALQKLYRKERRLYENALIIRLAARFVKKWHLEWDSSDTLKAILYCNGIYYSAEVYFISLLIWELSGLLLCLPILFVSLKVFCVMVCAVLLFVVGDFCLLLFRHQAYITALRRELPMLGILARKYFGKQGDLVGFIELAQQISGKEWDGIWRESLIYKESAPEQIGKQKNGWRDAWLIRFAEGLVCKEKGAYFKNFYRELSKEWTEQRKKRLQRICRWVRILQGVFFLFLTLIFLYILT